MIEKIHIENYKSISSLDLELGRVTILIGENGSGKSNILEAIALASAASQDKLDNEFLGNRGIRVSHPYFMRSAFDSGLENEKIKISIHEYDKQEQEFNLQNENQPYSQWKLEREKDKLTQKFLELTNNKAYQIIITDKNEIYVTLNNQVEYDQESPDVLKKEIDIEKDNLITAQEVFELQEILNKIMSHDIDSTFDTDNKFAINDFLVYSPEDSALRNFEKEAQIEPLSIKGEGLYKLLKFTSLYEPEKINIIKEYLSLISWFSDFEIPIDKFGSKEILLTDKYIQQTKRELYNHKNTNEGFLFILFYILLFVSDKTPTFFAIDNIDASLNPKLCTELARRIVQLAKKYDKQVILTTHNPAILDGIDLNDEEQKILVVSRNMKGHTRLREVKPPKARRNKPPMKLSEAFLKGMIGGLPDTFSLFSPIKEEEREEGEEKEDIC